MSQLVIFYLALIKFYKFAKNNLFKSNSEYVFYKSNIKIIKYKINRF